MASPENSRKKRKVTYADYHASTQITPPATASGSALPLPPTTAMAEPANAPCHHEHALKALNSDLDAMRQLITCKICDRLLYEPYALSCGHTYCYSCLAQWLGTNAKMTCPDCRTVIRQQPTPSYLIRELVLVFVSRSELLPDGETAEEHNKSVREEAEIVAKDKANTDRRTGGLFKGRFNRSRLNLLGPLRDHADGVDRCPGCQWELEDGHCNQCGFEDDDFSLGESGSDISDEDVDFDLRDMDDVDGLVGADGEDDFAFDAQYHRERNGDPVHVGPRRWAQYALGAHRGSPIDLQASSEEESEEDEYDQNDTFIDDNTIEEIGEGSEAESDVTAGRNPSPPVRRRNLYGRLAPVVISDDEDDDDEATAIRAQTATARGRFAPRRRTPIAPSDDDPEDGDETAPSATHGADETDSDSDSEDEGPVVRGSQRSKRPNVAVRTRRAVTVTSDEESEESDHDGTSETAAPGGFSPIDDGSEDGASEQTYYEDEFYDGGDSGDFAAPAFNPYEPEDASAGGYDDESDDGWAQATTTSSNAMQPLAAPSARLGTLQQRRPRHISPQYRPALTLSPSTVHRPARSLYQPSAAPHPQTNAYSPRDPTAMPPPLPIPAPQLYQPTLAHPFQLDNVLHRANNNTLPVANHPLRASTYNQRNQQARTYPYQRNVPAPVNPTGAAAQPGSSTGNRTMMGPSSDAHRKRALSVASDDSQDYYV